MASASFVERVVLWSHVGLVDAMPGPLLTVSPERVRDLMADAVSQHDPQLTYGIPRETTDSQGERLYVVALEMDVLKTLGHYIVLTESTVRDRVGAVP